jgi:hypothetical protein
MLQCIFISLVTSPKNLSELTNFRTNEMKNGMMTEPTEDTPLHESFHLESKKRVDTTKDKNVS